MVTHMLVLVAKINDIVHSAHMRTLFLLYGHRFGGFYVVKDLI